MNLKIIFGIILPALLIVALTFIASVNTGFSAKKEFVSTLTNSDIFSDGKVKSLIQIGEVKISNDYFLPKRYELPKLLACLVDKEGVKEATYAGHISYSEGDLIPNSGQYDYYGSNYGNAELSVQVPANEKEKIVNVYISPSIYYQNQDQLRERYGDYDELLLVNSEDLATNDPMYSTYSRYPSCDNLPAKGVSFKNGIHIPILL